MLILIKIYILCSRITEESCSTWVSTVHEFRNNIKIECDDMNITDIKLEPVDTYESIEISNYIKHCPQQYNCDECYEIFNDSNQLIIHKNFKHKNKPYVCQICNERFILSAHLNLHLIEHVDYQHFKNNRPASLPLQIQSSPKNNLESNSQKTYYRSLKSVQNSSNNNAKRNQQKKVLKKNIKNKLIKSTINNCDNFKIDSQHIAKCKPFKCPNCTFGTKSEAKFVDHENYCTNISENSYKQNLPSHCHLCLRQFVSQTALNGHMKYHGVRGEIIPKRQKSIKKITAANQLPKIYNCKYCDRQFMSLKKLHVHYSQHKKQMMCNICNKQFFLKKMFERHMEKHNKLITNDNQNEYNTSYNQSNLLKQKLHKKVIKCKFTSKFTNVQKKNYFTQQIKDFKCLECNSYYKTRKTLLAHNRQFHPIEKQIQQPLKSQSAKDKCNWCNILITKPNLYRHIKSFHPNVKSVKCLYCSVTFKDHPSRKLHVSEYHKNK